ncbi:MAG TPA: hypothetical protein VFD00_09485 [Thermoclostridium sp.]|nr:hypothetical protein [Thermoclostridium sp.]
MYVLLISPKKRVIKFIILLAVVGTLLGVIQLSGISFQKSCITIENRISFTVPTSTEMSSVYSPKLSNDFIQASLVLGNTYNSKTIQRQGLSDISFSYPETLRLDDIQNLGQEITVHINFMHEDSKMAGFFQVWELNQSVEELLNSSKKLSSMTFMDFNEFEMDVNGMKGFVWEYIFVSTHADTKGLEVFIENGNEMYRFSMFVPNDDYKSAYKRILMQMVKSIRLKNKATAELV